jgi:hypothetical protein
LYVRRGKEEFSLERSTRGENLLADPLASERIERVKSLIRELGLPRARPAHARLG